MEKRLCRKVDEHFVGIKDNIKDWLSNNNVKCMSGESDVTSDLLKYVYDMEGLQISKEDFQKRKRVKNVVPHNIRCCAKRANGEQCTRRRLNDENFCGTHIKGTPHGEIDASNLQQDVSKKVQIWVEEIGGIHYYIDDENNVYEHADILANKGDPSIIGKWAKKENGEYYIPEFT